MSGDRSWMYCRFCDNGILRAAFCDGVKEFLDYAFTQAEYRSGDRIRCPCFNCDNKKFLDRDTVNVHLLRKGFTPGYYTWFAHGEIIDGVASESRNAMDESNFMATDFDRGDPYRTMVMEAMGPAEDFQQTEREVHHDEEPNKDAADFYSLLKDAEVPLWDGCEKHSKLSVVSQLLNCKSEFNMSVSCYDRIMKIMKDMLPESENLPADFYQSKRMLRKLGMKHIMIDVCENNCMLFYKEKENLTECEVCGHPRFKLRRNGGKGRRKDVPYRRLQYLPITPRLQRLFMSSKTAEHMTWHSKGGASDDMEHPSCGEAWKHFDRVHPSFSVDPRNVRLVLCTDGFCPFNQSARPYSCWPVFIAVYNLPPSMCMTRPYIFLSLVISGPKSPGKSIDVLLRPLIDELKMLWDVGVTTYDISKKENFQMKAALLWTISDFPAYGMLSGWSTHGKLACPYCMEKSKAFTLKHGGKTSFFDCHRQFLPMDHAYRKQVDGFFKGRMERDPPPPRLSGEDLKSKVLSLPDITFGFKAPKQKIPGFGKEHNWVKRSIFWELKYWPTLLIRHNLDVMHIVRNVFLNIFYTCMDVKGKTKDNVKARQDLELYCKRPNLELIYEDGKPHKPPASYVLPKDKSIKVCEWVKELRLPDGYASNIAQCVNLDDYNFTGLKSHDCHIFMLRLLPIAFREMLPKAVWDALTELSCYFRDLCNSTLRVNDMEVLEKNIVLTLCKLEKILPPSFFDSMEHLPIHLAYEAKVGGPVQYRWMYPFERLMHDLKRKVKNPAAVEGSIVQAYLLEEISNFCSHYFEPTVQTRLNQVPRNDDGDELDCMDCLSIFTHPGRSFGKHVKRYLTCDEYKAAHMYVTLNCEEVRPFGKYFDDYVRQCCPNISEEDLEKRRETEFPTWFSSYVENNQVDSRLKDLAQGPSKLVTCYKGYFVNGFRFHTKEYGKDKKTFNSGVGIKGSTYNDYESDYYGMLVEIIELEYFGEGNKVVLFKCDWYDTEKRGIKVDAHHGLVELNYKLRLQSGAKEPFVLAEQAYQVYYTSYPGCTKSRKLWWAVVKTKARGRFSTSRGEDEFYQGDDDRAPTLASVAPELDNPDILVDFNRAAEEVDVEEVESTIEPMEQDANDEEVDPEEEDTFIDFNNNGDRVYGMEEDVSDEEDFNEDSDEIDDMDDDVGDDKEDG